jgi:hypothetical protein
MCWRKAWSSWIHPGWPRRSSRTQRGFAIDDLAAEPVKSGSAAQADGDEPAMVVVTMHVHGKRPVSELASALTELDLVEAVVAANDEPADD